MLKNTFSHPETDWRVFAFGKDKGDRHGIERQDDRSHQISKRITTEHFGDDPHRKDCAVTTRQNVFSTPMNRRRAFGMIAGAAVAGSSLGLLSRSEATQAAGGVLEAVRDLNLRSEASIDSPVIGWIGTGQLATDVVPGQPEMIDGYRHITTDEDVTGWALDDGLKWQYDTDPDPELPAVRYLAREDNLLLDPGGEPIMWLDFGTQVRPTDEVSGEYRLVRVNNVEEEVDGWIRNWVLTPDSTARFTVDAPIPGPNAPLLAAPDLEAEWVAEVPEGEYVLDYDHEVVNGFYGVQWRDVSGWMLESLLVESWS